MREHLKQNGEKADMAALYSGFGLLSGGLAMFVVGFVVHKQNIEKVKITGPNLLEPIFSVSDLESSSLAGYFRLNRSNLCTHP